ncbi:hypothetical protein GCM10028773_04530 [Spirosoma koreense]
MTKVAASLLLSASTIINPTTPNKALSFDASAYVTINHQIRVAVQKKANVPVTVLLRDKDKHVLYQQHLNRKEEKHAMMFNVDALADGEYELEVKSSEGSIRKQLNLSTQPVQQTSRIVAMQ